MKTFTFPAPLPLKQEAVVAFGPFQLYAAQKLLLNRGEPVRLGGRAIDLLLALVRQPGQLLSQRELVAQVWPNTVVEDSSLRVHIAALRRALRDDGADGRCYIGNVPGRGYRFTAAIEARQQDSAASAAVAPSLRLSSVIGRAHDLEGVAERLGGNRLVSIVGPGGVGKSTLAAAAAAKTQAHFAAGVFHLDLGPLQTGQQLTEQLAQLPMAANGEALLLLDNCEHLIGPAAALAERLLRNAPGLTVLATSREPLLVDGEYLCRIAPLALPPAHGAAPLNPNAYPALQLFLDRARKACDTFELDSANLHLSADICRRLDGLPLALEIAAAAVAALGLHGLSDQLGRQQLSLAAARRNGPANQASLSACYAWSHALLPAGEQTLWRRLAALAPGFTLEAACTLAEDIGMTTQQLTRALMALVSKSLLMAEFHATDTRYRLLNTARAYAAEHPPHHPATPLLSGEKNVIHV
jgi:predicted ATPase/DNA-binding winged helix-turn-helix (wHTH) protein